VSIVLLVTGVIAFVVYDIVAGEPRSKSPKMVDLAELRKPR
jgi:hypothetical protein